MPESKKVLRRKKKGRKKKEGRWDGGKEDGNSHRDTGTSLKELPRVSNGTI